MSKPREPRRISPTYLENAALHYLERFAASAEGLRRLLMRKLRRAEAFHGEAAVEGGADGAALIDGLIARYLSAGLLDDRAYAGMKGRSLLRRGVSVRGIRQRLDGKGVAAELIEATLAELAAEAGAAGGDGLDRDAALAFARRRRIGPFRPAEARAPHRQRDLAALGRAGFSYEVARAVVDAEGG